MELVFILPSSGTFGSRRKRSAENQQLGEAVDIILQLGKGIVRGGERVWSKLFQDTFQKQIGENYYIIYKIKKDVEGGTQS